MARSRHSKYTAEMVEFLLDCLRKVPQLSHPEAATLFERAYGFRPSKSYQHNLARKHGLRRTGNPGCFRPGNIPVNKGVKIGSHPGSIATQFKPGRVPHNEVPMWHERFNKRGGVEIKIPENNPYSNTDYVGRFVAKARWIWEQRHGPIPEGHVIVHIDGDELNNDVTNLECVSRRVLIALNHFTAPKKSDDPVANEVRLRRAQLKVLALERKNG